MDDKLKIAGREFDSRLIVGTGKYENLKLMKQALQASGTRIVTVADTHRGMPPTAPAAAAQKGCVAQVATATFIALPPIEFRIFDGAGTYAPAR